jgi:(2R)-3-sulfolactate dehydrogenase (NADP+)
MSVLTLDDIEALAHRALAGSGAADRAALVVAGSMRDAEAEGLRNIGLSYLPTYCEHLRIGKIVGDAVPSWTWASRAVLLADAAHGFAHVAFIDALDPFVEVVEANGVGVLAITRSYSAGVVGWFVDLLARRGLVSLAFANASALMPAWGGSTPRFGTNPLGFGAPRAGGEPIVVDMATSTTARVNILAAAGRGERLPEGWALDAKGRPTTDPVEAVAGMNSPLGGAKGFGLALMVDVLAGGLSGSNFSHQASGLMDNEGGPPGVGQLFVAFSPEAMGASGFAERLAGLSDVITAEAGVRMPGDRRHECRAAAELDGVEVPDDLIAHLEGFASGTLAMLNESASDKK